MPWNPLGFLLRFDEFSFHANLKHWSFAATVRFPSEKLVWKESQVHSCRVGGNFYVLIRPQRTKSVISISAFRDTRRKELHSEMWFHSDSISLKAKRMLQLFGPPQSCLEPLLHCPVLTVTSKRPFFLIPFAFCFILMWFQKMFTQLKIFEPAQPN